ncbi:MAG: hypothetical protein JW794_02210 [Candidatus Cloacimonetes bacterium]|nr:hypothetical protein [Candidatus Cloacimonadota bacterium]
MKKNLIIITAIVLIALAFSFCSKSSGPTPDFKYLGTWTGQNSYSYPVEIRVANVSNKQKITYIELIAAAKWDSINFINSSTSGLTEIIDDSFSYTDTDLYTITIDGTFQSETSLNGTFNVTFTDDPPMSGTYTVTKQ